MLTSNWEVKTGGSPYSFISFIQAKKNVFFSSYIEDNETNLSIENHILRVIYDNLKKKFQNLVSMFDLCDCFNLLHFVSISTSYAVAYCHMHLWITDQSWQTAPNEFVLHFEAVFVVF